MSPAGDSAGVPWAGRTLTDQPFAGDDGSTDAPLLAALTGWHAAHRRSSEVPPPDGSAQPSRPRSDDRSDPARPAAERPDHPVPVALSEVVRAWAPTRVLVPIVAVLGADDELTAAADHGQGDKSADMALVTLTGPDGRKILPTFTSTAALAAWNPTARPVPVEAARAAQAAVLEECDLVAIDPAGPIQCLLPRPAVWAVAQGRDWLPPAEDRDVLTAVEASLRSVPTVVAHRCEPDGPAGLNVVLGLPPGLDAEQVHQVTARAAQSLAADPVIAERTESLRLTVRAA
jgi:type III secretion system (T3SS) SseB-like protein